MTSRLLRRFVSVGLLLAPPSFMATRADAQAPLTVAQLTSAPFATGLTAAATVPRIAWTLNAQGVRNVWVAEAPAFTPRRLTAYLTDDGQELTAVQLSPDGRRVIYVRGGDFGSNWDDPLPVNPTRTLFPPKTEIWSVPFDGGAPVSLGEGLNPVISPRGDVVVFERGGQLWRVPIDGATPARKLFEQRGAARGAQFSPDGSRLAFVSARGDHSFIVVYTNDSTPLHYIAPTTSRDDTPRWSRDGTRLAFVRRPGGGGPPPATLELQPAPWSLWIANMSTGSVRPRWHSDTTLRGSLPSTHGGVNLHWAADERLVFLSYHDGWPHLYSLRATGTDAPLLLTPGDHMAEHITLSGDGRWLYYAGNLGTTPGDIDRRHVVRAAVDRAAPAVLTPGTGIEFMPVPLSDGRVVAIGGGAQQPPAPFLLDLPAGAPPRADTRRVAFGTAQIPADFPAARLVVPTPVTYTSSDGVRVHAQLFMPPAGGPSRKAAVVYVHGGPPRQMLLGWHYGDYYWNAYAMNQYLASRGFVVLAINYRLGIGYGHDFHRPPNAGIAGASEYLDVVGAAQWLRTQSFVDASRIGIYGGSYGGFLTALALARNSDLFAAGVDIHGVHDWTSDGASRIGGTAPRADRSPAVVEQLLRTAWTSSPVSSLDTWKSPVLFIHADDDRNVRFSQTVDLIARLRGRGVRFEELTIVDDTHHFMQYENQRIVNEAIAAFLERELKTSR